MDADYLVHKNFGPGSLEENYKVCSCHELTRKELQPRRQIDLPIKYDGMVFEEGLRNDVLVDNLVICELKAVDCVNPVWEAQPLSHLTLINKRLGFLINFNVPVMKNGVERFIL